MSGDVQPRKRKDKKKKKDELGLEEPRGTAAALGEGDVFMHSYSDHGTGGHWCAKIIFFSLLAVLVTLIGLIILENRGLSELEANAVESRYSNILEGWLEDAPDDDHHDEHTLELKHHDDDEEDDHYDSHGVDDHEDEDDEHVVEDEDEHADEDEHEDEDEDEQADEDEHEDEDEQNEEEDDQQEIEEADDEDEDDRSPYKYYAQDDEEDDEDETKNNVDDEDEQETAQDEDEDQDEQNDDNESNEEFENENDDDEDRDVEVDEDEESNQSDDDEQDDETGEDDEEHDDHEDKDDEMEVEKIEREASEEEPITIGLPVLPEEDDDDDDEKDKDDNHDEDNDDAEDEAVDDDVDADDDDFLEAEVPPVVERVTAPAGKPFVEVDEDEVSTEAPPDTLEEEEEYEKQQEEKRKEEEQSSHHIWLKLSVGAALLVATHALVRRATAPRDEAEEHRVVREETPLVDRRMTLIPEEATPPVVPKKESEKPVLEEIVRREAPVVKAPPVTVKQESEEEEAEEPELEDVAEEEEVEEDEPEKLEAPKKGEKKDEEEKELYSDEEEEEEEEEVVVQKKEAPKIAEPAKQAPEPEDEDPDDVEIIDDEQLEEELEEEEEVSDVDDSELLSRLEAKYGRLPEPERPGQRHKDGGNSVEDMWPGEPADAYWRQQLDSAERELRQGAWSAAMARAGAPELRPSARARYVAAAALDRLAEARRDNGLLSKAIAAYFDLLQMSESLSVKKLLEVARRTLDRIQFRGNYIKAEPVYRLLIRRFPNEPAYRNNMTISFLMAGRNDLAENVLKETLARWPDDRVALAHYAFILKTSHKDKLEEAVELFRKALEGDKGPACEPRFYYHYGDALLLLGRFKEAHEVHKRGAELGHFLSAAQRSLYNVPRLKSRPWWNVDETPYRALARNLEKRWKEILKEGQKAAGLYKEEEEGLRERGEWSQMDLFVRGQEIPGRCAMAPVTCAVVKAEAAAAGCRRGQVKFSSMAPGTHVRPHVGPTNCRLRMHLGLSNTKGTYLRVDQETRQWQEGKVLLFDDSFEHEVWHNGSAVRLVLIVDVWHPDLSPAERRALPPI